MNNRTRIYEKHERPICLRDRPSYNIIYFSTGNGQPSEPALCQLYRHTLYNGCRRPVRGCRHVLNGLETVTVEEDGVLVSKTVDDRPVQLD